MRSTKLIPTTLLALSLALAAPAARAAQDAPAEAGAVAYATGTWTGQPARMIDPQEESPAEGVRQMRGWSAVGIPIELTDPRLSGSLTFVANGAGQDFADGFANIESRTYRLENEQGVWTGSGIAVFALEAGEPLIDRESGVLVGEGAYEGLMAYMYAESVGNEVVVEALVLENEVAPAPDPVPATVLEDVPAFAEVADTEAFLGGIVGDAPGGVAGLIVRDGETMTTTVGTANATGDLIQADAAFRVGSISKTFLSAMVLQLVDEGLVDLDAPLSTYLPETTIGGSVTVRQLLSHRSGIPSITDQDQFWSDQFEDLERRFSPADTLGYVAEVPASEPDQEFYYSNTNYILLGQLLEAVGGDDLNTALEVRIVEPLGLTATKYDIDGASAPDTLVGAWDGETFAGDPNAEYASLTSAAWSAGSLVSTAADLATFINALFAGDLISEASLTQMLETGPEGYGLGIGTMPPGADPGAFYGHNGGIPGYGSFMASNPETGDTVVLLSNTDGVDPTWAAAQIFEAWANAGS